MSKETFEEFMQDHLPEMKTVNERRYFRYIWNHQQKKIDELETKLKRAMEGIDFYADCENWYIERFTKRDVETVIRNHCGIDLQSDNGGKLARTIKKELEKE